MPQRFLIVAAPPTTNGDLHLGHLAGPYLAANVHARYLRSQGHEAYVVSGSDDNLSYVQYFAEQRGVPAESFVAHWSEEVRRTFEAAHAMPDRFVQPHRSQAHSDVVRDFYRRLLEAGKIELRDGESAYCEHCARFLFEISIVGSCPGCGAEATGYGCEDCGQPNGFGEDLRDPICNYCHKPAARRASRRLFLPLSKYEGFLRDYHRRMVTQPYVRTLCDALLASGLRDVPLSQSSTWGIPTGLSTEAEDRFFSIFEMVPMFLAGARSLSEPTTGGREFWRPGGEGVIAFFGFDNAFFYAILFPVLYHLHDPELAVPTHLCSNEFYLLDGEKFSTSRDHAIWGRDLIEREGVDRSRFYLGLTRPENGQSNFTLEEFGSVVRRRLDAGLRALEARLPRLAERHEPAPTTDHDWRAEERRYRRRIAELRALVEEGYRAASFSLRAAGEGLASLLELATEIEENTQPWREALGRGAERRAGLAAERLTAETFTELCAPLMPGVGRRLQEALTAAQPALAPGSGSAA